MVGVVAIDRCGVGATLVDRDLLGLAVPIDRPLEEAASSSLVSAAGQREIDRVAVAIDGPIQIPPATADFYVCLVHTPALAYRALAAAEDLGQHRHDLQRQ